MIDITKIKVGDKVHYQPSHYSENKFENGLVKEIPTFRKDAIRVVYNCDGNWHRFKEYTSAMTRIEDLKLGWRYK